MRTGALLFLFAKFFFLPEESSPSLLRQKVSWVMPRPQLDLNLLLCQGLWKKFLRLLFLFARFFFFKFVKVSSASLLFLVRRPSSFRSDSIAKKGSLRNSPFLLFFPLRWSDDLLLVASNWIRIVLAAVLGPNRDLSFVFLLSEIET